MRKANVYNGTLQVYTPIVNYGNSKPLAEGGNSEFSVGVTTGNNRTLKLNKVNNKEYIHYSSDGRLDEYLSLPDSGANISYRLVQLIANISGTHYIKKINWYYGGSIGLSPFPYISPTFGYNTKYFEIGVNTSLGVFANKVYLEGHRVNEAWDGRDGSEDYIIDEDIYWHMYNDFNVFTNIYYKNMSLGYNGTIAYPYGVYKSLNGYDVSFNFPYLISNKIGIGYNRSGKYARIGFGQITGDNFSDRLYSINFTIGSSI